MHRPPILKGDPEDQARTFIRHLAGRGLVAFLVSTDEEVPSQIWEAILQIRDSGLTNMFDYLQVAHLMEQSGYKIEAAWVNDHPGQYGQMIVASCGVPSLRDSPKGLLPVCCASRGLGVGRPLGEEKRCADR